MLIGTPHAIQETDDEDPSHDHRPSPPDWGIFGQGSQPGQGGLRAGARTTPSQLHDKIVQLQLLCGGMQDVLSRLPLSDRRALLNSVTCYGDQGAQGAALSRDIAGDDSFEEITSSRRWRYSTFSGAPR